MDDKFIQKAAKALSDKNRLNILKEIVRKKNMTCSDAKHICSLAQPSISHHIKLLTDSELVDFQKEGRNINLSINKHKVGELISFLQSFIKE